MRRKSINADVTVTNLFKKANEWERIFLEGGTHLHPHEYAEAVLYYGRAITALAAVKNGADRHSDVYEECVKRMYALRDVYNQRYPSRMHLESRTDGMSLVRPRAYQDEKGVWRTGFMHKRIREMSDLPW